MKKELLKAVVHHNMQWIKDSDGRRYKVTVDYPKAPFSHISSMARQAGVTKKRFYQALGK
ncbi:MAG: hypothetical protein ABFS56_33200 [Pseudomonadota bacterium]